MENTKKGGIRIIGKPEPILIILARVPRIFPLTGTWDTPIGVCPVRPANVSPRHEYCGPLMSQCTAILEYKIPSSNASQSLADEMKEIGIIQ